MTKINKFIELLNDYKNSDLEIVDQNFNPFIHIINRGDKLIISTEKPIGYCPRCGDYVYPYNDFDEYVAQCPECNESYYLFEIDKIELEDETEA